MNGHTALSLCDNTRLTQNRTTAAADVADDREGDTLCRFRSRPTITCRTTRLLWRMSKRPAPPSWRISPATSPV
ncbi:hypothetical protein BRL74_05195, partial [Xanthomonas oryzae pv. oryzae]